jgi:hypothetical protein
MIDYEYAILEAQETEAEDCTGCEHLEDCRKGIYETAPCEATTIVYNPYF